MFARELSLSFWSSLLSFYPRPSFSFFIETRARLSDEFHASAREDEITFQDHEESGTPAIRIPPRAPGLVRGSKLQHPANWLRTRGFRVALGLGMLTLMIHVEFYRYMFFRTKDTPRIIRDVIENTRYRTWFNNRSVIDSLIGFPRSRLVSRLKVKNYLEFNFNFKFFEVI